MPKRAALIPAIPASMRDGIIDAASDILIEKGLGGLTFAETGRRVGLKVTSVTHYFKRRDDLAAACFDRALNRLHDLVDTALLEASVTERARRYFELSIDVLRQARLGRERPIPVLSGIMTLDPVQQQPLMDRYHLLFRRVRDMIDEGRGVPKHVMNARTHVFLELAFWLPNTLRDYDTDDFDRVGVNIFRILSLGLAGSGLWSPCNVEVKMAIEPRGLRELIVAATKLINEQGYRGASINKVVGSLDLTKGSFYHHLGSRDALTLECFGASYDTIVGAQRTVRSLDNDSWTQLVSAISSIIGYQFSSTGMLLRTTALQGLPLEQRENVLARARQVARGFADLVTDGFVNGGGRPHDAMIAGHVISSMVSSAYVMVNWASRLPLEDAVQIYASPVVEGMFDERE